MTRSRLPLAPLALMLAVAACGTAPPVSHAPTGSGADASPTATPAPSDVPFRPVAWPASGSACGTAGISRIAAPSRSTVVLTLCAPDGAFLARLASPALGVVDAAGLARVAGAPAAVRDLSGHGAYRVVRWGNANVELARVGPASAGATASTVILRWAGDPASRTADLVAGSVDGIDAPTADGLGAAATTPALHAVPRPLLAVAVLGFGRDRAFADARVRRAIAMGVDTAALARVAFPAGSVAADHLAPCEVPAGCAGGPFRAFNAPAAVAALQALSFPLGATYALTVPDAPVPGLPDPAGAAAALAAQLTANLGIAVAVTALPADQFRAAVDGGSISGLYLDGVASAVADPSAFYGPLLLDHPPGLAARRAAAAAKGLRAAAADPDPGARAAAYAAAANSVRDSVPVAPLVRLGAMTLFASDVTGVTLSPLGADGLGAMVAGDRGQVVFEQAAPPGGGWCGAQAGPDAARLCALVTDGLYGYAPGSLDPAPRLATACTPSGDATVWTCRLREERAADGLPLDAADVVAAFRAMADPSDPVHVALGDGAFAAWRDLFGPPPAAAPGPSAPPPSAAP